VAPLERDEALAELTRRYFRCHGPATAKDFTWWSSLTVADAKRGLDMVGNELARAQDGVRTYWFADETLPAAARTPMAHLIQGYDEYVVAYRESRDVFYPARPSAAGAQPPFTHALILDGRLIGHWRFVPGTGSTAIVVRPYEPLRRREQRALDDAAARYEAYLGTSVRLRRGN
jgi:Winged helix DNA-binding domain